MEHFRVSFEKFRSSTYQEEELFLKVGFLVDSCSRIYRVSFSWSDLKMPAWASLHLLAQEQDKRMQIFLCVSSIVACLVVFGNPLLTILVLC